LKKTHRRIEITAFRRRVTVTGDVNCSGGNEPPLQCNDYHLSADTDIEEACRIHPQGTFATIELARSPELRMLVEALFKNHGDSALAAQELHLSPSSFYAKLQKLGLSITNLKARLNLLRDRRDKGRENNREQKEAPFE